MNGHMAARFLQEATVVEMVSDTKYVGKLYARGTTVPTDDDPGYAVGCIFIHTDNADNSDIAYINIGTAAACNFNAITVAAD